MQSYIIYESFENTHLLEYVSKKINGNEYFLPKSSIWKLIRIFDTYMEALDYAKINKINNTQIICKISLINTINNILDCCNIKSTSHGYITGMNIGIRSNIKILPPCSIDNILTIINTDKIINLI